MKKLCVALLSGGLSSEAEVSRMGGDQVQAALNPDRYTILRYDPRTDLSQLIKDADKIEVALIILHGPHGEDGRIQGFLDTLGIPYQGSGVLGSALAMNKLATKRIYEKAGIATPAYVPLFQDESKDIVKAAGPLGFPVVVKPASGGSSIGMGIVDSEAGLGRAVDKAFEEDDTVILEAYVKGRELTGAVLGNARLEALPIVEIIPGDQFDYFDYEAKYTPGATREICPAEISPEETKDAMDAALAAHRALFCKGYSRTDMILADGVMQVLETNTIPGMTPTSLLPQAAREAGLSFSALLDRLIELALET